MEVLDTSIANVALPHIAGSLGASTDQGTWVLTSYLVSNAIVLPIGAWASSVLGRRNFFLLCIVIFTVSSFLCGAAPSLPMLLLFRVIQGAGGGGMQPMAQAIMADSSSRKSAARPLPSTAWSPCSRPPSAPRWAAGSPTTSPGAGSSSSTFRSAFWPSFWSPGWSKIRPGSRPTARACATWTTWA